MWTRDLVRRKLVRERGDRHDEALVWYDQDRRVSVVISADQDEDNRPVIHFSVSKANTVITDQELKELQETFFGPGCDLVEPYPFYQDSRHLLHYPDADSPPARLPFTRLRPGRAA